MLTLLLVGAAALLAVSGRDGPRRPPAAPGQPRARRPPDPGRLAGPAALLLGAAAGMAVRPVAGLLIAVVGWWFLPALIGRMRTSEQVRLQQALSYQLPVAAGLVSACLAAGATPGASLRIVAGAVQDPAAAVLDRAGRTAELGGGPAEMAAVFASTGNDGWQAMGTAILRSSATGAPLADLLHEQADRALAAWHTAASVRARGTAVKSVLPLAACYLPSFLLLGVAPIVAGLLTGLDWL